MSHALLENLDLFIKLALGILGTIITLYMKKLQASQAPQIVKDSVGSIADIARISVGNMYQTVVRDLKDPSKSGAWDEKAKAAAKESVMASVHTLGAGAIKALRESGYDHTNVQMLVSHAIEGAVAELKAKNPESASMPLLQDRPTVPPEVPATAETPKVEAPQPIEPKA